MHRAHKKGPYRISPMTHLIYLAIYKQPRGCVTLKEHQEEQPNECTKFTKKAVVNTVDQIFPLSHWKRLDVVSMGFFASVGIALRERLQKLFLAMSDDRRACQRASVSIDWRVINPTRLDVVSMGFFVSIGIVLHERLQKPFHAMSDDLRVC